MASFQSQSPKLPRYPSGAGSLFLHSQLSAKIAKIPTDLDLSGQTAIITGANTGIAFECAKQLLGRGLSSLIVTTRSQAKAEITRQQLRKLASKEQDVDAWILDMNSYKSIQEFAERCGTLKQIDLVILSAGMTAAAHTKSPETGHEELFQVNYLSTMLIILLLLPVLQTKKPVDKASRVTVVTSGLSMHAKFPQAAEPSIFKAIDNPSTFDAGNHYNLTKLLGHLFIDRLSHLVNSKDIVLNLVDPGLTKGTDLHTDLIFIFRAILGTMKSLIGRSLEEGAATYIDAAVIKGSETHGSYIMDGKIFPYGNFYYTDEREKGQQKLWEETLAEFKFANVEEILAKM